MPSLHPSNPCPSPLPSPPAPIMAWALIHENHDDSQGKGQGTIHENHYDDDSGDDTWGNWTSQGKGKGKR